MIGIARPLRKSPLYLDLLRVAAPPRARTIAPPGGPLVEAEVGSDLFSEQSGIHGLGVFTRKAISQGAFVIQCQGILRHKDEVVEGMRALQIGPETYLAEDPENPRLDDFINHSCAPNVGFTDGSPKLFAIRDITVGEELFWDYRTSINEAGWSVACTCGAPNCRGKIQSYCDLPGEEKIRLRGIALEYLR
jgi:hypothetical protein